VRSVCHSCLLWSHTFCPQVTLDALGQTIGSDTVSVTIGSEGGNYAPRTYTSLTQLANEVGLSRTLGGVVSHAWVSMYCHVWASVLYMDMISHPGRSGESCLGLHALYMYIDSVSPLAVSPGRTN
jgi:hypothetical protein